jgi:hypothetical protein
MELNIQLEENIVSLGSFSLTFNIWTSNSSTSFLRVIIIFIDSNFKLNYKLIG